MIAHLSSEQLSECIVGQPSAGIAQHIKDCPICRAELASFRQALSAFRGTVREWSEDQAYAAAASPVDFSESHSWKPSRQLAWVLLIAGLFMVASFVVPWRPAEPPALASRDAVLLNQVDAQVSRSVPSSMEPLMKLVVQTNSSSEKQE